MKRLGNNEFEVIRTLIKQKSITRISRDTQIRKEQLGRKEGAIKNLKDMELIKISKKEGDKRFKLISLTTEGKELLRVLKKIDGNQRIQHKGK